MMIDADAFHVTAFIKGADLAHISLFQSPVYQYHTEDNTDHHAGSGDGETESDAVLPVEAAEHIRRAKKRENRRGRWFCERFGLVT